MNTRFWIAATLLSGTVLSGIAVREIDAQSLAREPQAKGSPSSGPKTTTFKFRSKTSPEEVARLRAEYAKHGPPTPAEVAKLKAIQGERFKEALALAKVGRYPVFHLGGPGIEPVPMVFPPTHGKGTKIVPEPNAEGEMLAVQKDFAAALAKGDTQPPDRINHFLWLNNTEAFKQGRARVVGWYGAVVETKRTPEGSWLLQIVIRPWIEHPGRGVLFDKVLETYEFSNGQVRLVRSDAHVATPAGQQVFPGAF